MKLNQEFVLRNIAGDKVIVPTSSAGQRINGLITLNSVAAFIWESVEKGEERDKIVSQILENYEIDEATAEQDVDGFLGMLKENGILLEE